VPTFSPSHQYSRDFAFYGNKLFQGKFIKIINPTASLFQIMLWTCLNSLVALIGYYFAAFTIDRPWMGRTRMQAMGFLWIGFLFLMCKYAVNHACASDDECHVASHT